MSDHQINYYISKQAKLMLLALQIIFLICIGIKVYALTIEFNIVDLICLAIGIAFVIFSSTAIWKLLVKKQPVASISGDDISVAVPYFFNMQKLPLVQIKEIKMSVWKRSEIVVFDAGEFRSFAFMAPFLASEDRESFLSNIFDLLPNAQIN